MLPFAQLKLNDYYTFVCVPTLLVPTVLLSVEFFKLLDFFKSCRSLSYY
nr:MAG TPA: hypothetical protein [Caudoviricetes sp.]